MFFAQALHNGSPDFMLAVQGLLAATVMGYYLPERAVEFCRAPTAPDIERRPKPGVHAGCKRTRSRKHPNFSPR